MTTENVYNIENAVVATLPKDRIPTEIEIKNIVDRKIGRAHV